jgi:Domain of Unknown Function (DUF928)
MKKFDRFHKMTHSWCLATIVILSAIVTMTTVTAIAQPPAKPKTSLKIRWKPPIPPSSLGIPGNRAQGGGTRGCQPYRGIAALVPMSPQQIAWGQTIRDRPTVWLNAPQGLGKDVQMEIAVRAENGNPIAKQSFTTKSKLASGAISVPFPPTTGLQLDRTYQWEVALYCDTEDRVDRPLIIQGKITRITAPAAIATAKSTLERVQILATNGIWYDAVTELGDRLRQTKDRELATTWSELLRSAGISGSDRLQDCCQIDSAKGKQ